MMNPSVAAKTSSAVNPTSSRPVHSPLWGDHDKGGFPDRNQTGFTTTTGHIILVILARSSAMKKMAAAQFKAQCLAVMDQVSQSGCTVVITKHGKAVVKLVPANEGEDEIFGALAGIARITGDIENTVPASDWGVE
jgi:prevent-host-death family protein